MRQIRHILPWVTRSHRFVHRVSGGRLGSWLFGFRFLVLEHVGRRSGVRRETPLLYARDEERFVVAASNAGQDHHPAWWLNLQANPDAVVRIGRRAWPVKARRAEGDEAARLWSLLGDEWGWFDSYREGTDRDIPVVVLEPTGTAGR